MTYLEMPETMGELRDDLAHFGVKGMKWGVRRGREKTGVGRIRGAAAQSLRDEARRRNTASKLGFLSSHAYGLTKGNPLRGKRGQAKVARKQEEAAARILAGKTKARDLLRVLGQETLLFDLAVTTTVRPGARQQDGTFKDGKP